MAEGVQLINHLGQDIGVRLVESLEAIRVAVYQQEKITPRVFLAGCAVAGLLANPLLPMADVPDYQKRVVECAVESADALLRALGEGDEDDEPV